ncbi:maltotransferase domain-containing protein [Inquilinus sp. CAU 1745]|uniref:alpha-1,4-glucan--maltose-1-phosphate maltosyltransferase n=1 Tax=Inquilinus sp. CAU 1745 TaxID=3140369 RepID=UPI00325BDAB3
MSSRNRTRTASSFKAPALSPGSAARLKALEARRFIITNVTPEIDGGRYPVKREDGDRLEVQADIVCDGHMVIAGRLLCRPADEKEWRETPLAFHDNDRWIGRAVLDRNTRFLYTLEAWIDEFGTWRRDLLKKANAGQRLETDLTEGAALVAGAAKRAKGGDRKVLTALAKGLPSPADDPSGAMEALLADPVVELMGRWGARTGLTRYHRELEVVVDRVQARYAAWYEMFWRSQGTDPTRGSTVDECIARFPYIRDMGFDVVYLVPHHPIGRTNRKGRNNSLVAGPDDPGSPYAIGSEEGGHDAVNPDWGTLEDFRRFTSEARDFGFEVAIDFAIQCSPDHPWIKEHHDWFRWRPDGSIKFAENPPKKYEDIVNVEFYGLDGEPIEDLWLAWREIVLFWIAQGVTIFRVDNPHTKSFPFWEWLIRDVQERHPEAIFLAEAFTRPKVMKGLAKLGFTQSYSYFTWRNGKQEITDYLTELTRQEPVEYMRANFFPNTPDILPTILQEGGRPAFLQRIVLAATLSSVYGMYNGYELCENEPVPGKEEYLNSEKYQYKVWDWDRPGNIRDWITHLNRIRRENPALHEYDNLKFYNAWNDQILWYGKMSREPGPDGQPNFVLVAVNLDPFHPQEATIELPLWEFGLPDWGTLEMEELFSGHRFTWTGKNQHLWIDNDRPAFIWRVTPA